MIMSENKLLAALKAELSSGAMNRDLTEELILRFAEELAADNVPVDTILRAWQAATKNSWGCLNNQDGQRCFVHARLRELECFKVGCHIDELRLTCELHMMDPSHWDDHEDWTRDFVEMFHRGDSIAATPTRKLIDAKPVNEVTRRAHQFPTG